jgi:hypothetical protein
MHPNVKTASSTKIAPPPSEGYALDLRQVAGRRDASALNKMNKIVANHLSESLNVIRNWLHQGR